MRVVALAVLLTLAAALVVVGVALVNVPAAFITSGVAVAALTVLTLREVDE